MIIRYYENHIVLKAENKADQYSFNQLYLNLVEENAENYFKDILELRPEQDGDLLIISISIPSQEVV